MIPFLSGIVSGLLRLRRLNRSLIRLSFCPETVELGDPQTLSSLTVETFLIVVVSYKE